MFVAKHQSVLVHAVVSSSCVVHVGQAIWIGVLAKVKPSPARPNDSIVSCRLDLRRQRGILLLLPQVVVIPLNVP